MTAYLRSHVRQLSSALRDRRGAELCAGEADVGAVRGEQRAVTHRIGWAEIAEAYWPGVLQARQTVGGVENRNCRDVGMPVESGHSPNFAGMSPFDVC